MQLCWVKGSAYYVSVFRQCCVIPTSIALVWLKLALEHDGMWLETLKHNTQEGSLKKASACWHRSEFNTAAQLFSHLHRPKRHVAVADVEQADSLREQPTKTESELVNTRNTPVLGEYLSGNNGENKSLYRFHFQLVTEQQRCEITPLWAILSFCAAWWFLTRRENHSTGMFAVVERQ